MYLQYFQLKENMKIAFITIEIIADLLKTLVGLKHAV